MLVVRGWPGYEAKRNLMPGQCGGRALTMARVRPTAYHPRFHRSGQPKKRRGRSQHAPAQGERRFNSIKTRSPVKGTTMAKVVFTPNIQRHVALPESEVSGRTVRDVLDAVF